MTVTKRNTKNEEGTEQNVETSSEQNVEPSSEEKVETPTKQCDGKCKNCSGCCCIKSLLIVIVTFAAIVGGFVFYLKQYQPELYAEKIEVLFQSSSQNQVASNNVPEAKQETVTNAPTEEPTSYEKKINLNDLEDVINLEEMAYIKNIMKEEEIYEKLKDKPELLKVKEYYEEPVGQLVRRTSLAEQVVLFINSNDERSKVTRLAISQAKVPYGVMEVDNEPRAGEIRAALFRMTAQRTFPFIFVNGKFFGNSFALQRAMQNGEFYELVDSEENKKNWLLEKEEYHQKILKRRKEKQEKEKKKLEEIKKKIEEKKAEL
eukprot:jgi/Orpsp1_1/1188459/evm.model.d7180000065015.1